MKHYDLQDDNFIADIGPHKPFLILDAYVLLARTKTGVYRTCDEIFRRLISSDKIEKCLLVRNSGDVSAAEEYLKSILVDSECGIIFGRGAIESIVRTGGAVWLFLPFGVPPVEWQEIPGLKYAHFCHDIIAVRKPELFTHEAASEVAKIIRWFNEVDLIFTNSEYTKRDLDDYTNGRLHEKLAVTPLAADKNMFNNKHTNFKDINAKRFGLIPNERFILSVGTLEIRKNLDTCIRAYGLLKDDYDFDGKLVLTGMSGWKEERIKSALNSLSSRAKRGIMFTGFVSDSELSWLYKNARCFVYMSEYEGFGLPPLEAMSCGLPVICSNSTSLPEVVESGGLLVDTYDYVGVASAIKLVWENDEVHKSLHDKASIRATLFDWNKTVSILLGTIGTYSPIQKINNKVANHQHLVSFITVTYNAEKTLERCITSVLECKKLIDCEYIVIDGKSTDSSPCILNKHRQEIDILVIEKDSGIYDAMNKGLSFAKGKFICFVNSDDSLIPKGVEKITHLLATKHPRLDILATTAISVDGDEKHYWQPAIQDNFLVFRCPNICHNAIYAHSSVFEKIGEFDLNLKIAADSDWTIRAYRAGAKFYYSTVPTMSFTLGGTSSDLSRHRDDMIKIAHKTYPNLQDKTIYTLFYHLFSWPERRKSFKSIQLSDFNVARRKAGELYPELMPQIVPLKQRLKGLALRSYAKLRTIARQHG